MKNILSLSKEEKNRILEMHISASKKHYLFESNGSGSEKLGLYAMEDGKKIGGIDATNIKYQGNPQSTNSDYLTFDYTYAGDTEKSRGQYFCKDKVIQVLNTVEYKQTYPDLPPTPNENEVQNPLRVDSPPEPKDNSVFNKQTPNQNYKGTIKQDVERKRYKLSSDGEKIMDSYCNQYAMNKQNNDELTA